MKLSDIKTAEDLMNVLNKIKFKYNENENNLKAFNLSPYPIKSSKFGWLSKDDEIELTYFPTFESESKGNSEEIEPFRILDQKTRDGKTVYLIGGDGFRGVCDSDPFAIVYPAKGEIVEFMWAGDDRINHIFEHGGARLKLCEGEVSATVYNWLENKLKSTQEPELSLESKIAALEDRLSKVEERQQTTKDARELTEEATTELEDPLAYKQILFDKKGRTVLVFENVNDSDVMIYCRRIEGQIRGWGVSKSELSYQSNQFLIDDRDFLFTWEASSFLNTTLEHLHSLFDKAEAEVQG